MKAKDLIYVSVDEKLWMSATYKGFCQLNSYHYIEGYDRGFKYAKQTLSENDEYIGICYFGNKLK